MKINNLIIIEKKKAAENNNNIVTSQSDFDELERRDTMLESLLILLNSAASLGFGPNPTVFGSESIQRSFTSEFPGKKFSKELDEISPVKSSSIPHYKLVEEMTINSRKRKQTLFLLNIFISRVIWVLFPRKLIICTPTLRR